MHLTNIPGVGKRKAKALHSIGLKSVGSVAHANYSYIDKYDGLSGELVGAAQSVLPEWNDTQKHGQRKYRLYCQYCGECLEAPASSLFGSLEARHSTHEQGCGRGHRNQRSRHDWERQFGDDERSKVKVSQ